MVSDETVTRSRAGGDFTDTDRDDLVVMRESIDDGHATSAEPGSPHVLVEGRVAAVLSRIGALVRPVVGRLVKAHAPLKEEREGAVTPMGDADPWAGRLTTRQKAARIASIAIALCLTFYLLLGGPAATGAGFHALGSTINARLHPAPVQRTLAQSGYVGVKSPPGAANVSGIALAPVDGTPGGAWACWASPFHMEGGEGAWSAHAFVTTSAGADWRQLTLPTTQAQGCIVSADPQRPGSAAFALTQGLAPDGSCIAPYLYLTDDGGMTWAHAPWPLSPSDAVCQFTLALRDGAIYVWSQQPLLRGLKPDAAPTGRFIVTRDEGKTWEPADSGLDGNAGLSIIGFRPGGHILASVQNRRGSGVSWTLMQSADFGASWTSLGELPGALPVVYASSDAAITDHGGWGRIYEIAESVTNGIPDGASHLSLATGYVNARWAPIPLPPMPAGADTNALSLQPVALGVGPGGSLEVERGIVEAHNAQLSPARRLWVWAPAARQWLLDPEIVPGNLQTLGVGWANGEQTFWLSTLQLGIPPTLQLFTKTYTEASIERASVWSR